MTGCCGVVCRSPECIAILSITHHPLPIDTSLQICYNLSMKLITVITIILTLNGCAALELSGSFAEQFLEQHGAEYRIHQGRIYKN